MSKIKVNEIEKASGSGITVPTGTSFTVTDGIAASSLTGTVAQAKIADQAINEAKMQISNAPTNGYMLTAQSGNTGGLTWAEAGGGAWKKLASTTLSTASAGVAFNNTYVNSTYDNYMIMAYGLLPVTDNADIGIFASYDNGSSFATISSGNWYLQINGTGNGWQHSQPQHTIAHDCSNVAGELKVSGYGIIEDVNNTTCWKTIFGNGATQNSGTKTNDYSYVTLSAVCATSALNYLMVKANSGNLQGFGTVTLYGMEK
jgi:hypothetical protein